MHENKMGTRPVFPLLMSMGAPAMLSMFIQSMYNVVDSMFVARIGADALTAVSLAFPVQNLILAAAVGNGIGINSLISRRLGEKRQKEADSAVNHGILIAVAVWALFALFGFTLNRSFFHLFTQSETVIELGVQYTWIVTFFSFGQLIHIAIEKVLQATGNMVYPMVFQAVGAIVNIILDPIFIFGYFGLPKMGVAGAAIATVIGQLVSMTLSLAVLVLKDHAVAMHWKGFRFNWKSVGQIFSVGFPSIVMQSLGSVLVMGLNAILISFSNTAVSLYGIYFKLQSFVFMPVSGLTQGAMPIMGYNYGAGKIRRLREALKDSLLVSGGIMLVGTGIFCGAPRLLLRLFQASEEMLSIGVPALRIISASFLFSAVGFVFSTLFQALGKGGCSLVIALLRQLVIVLPLAFLLAPLWGLTGVWITFPVAEGAAALVSVIMYQKTKKKFYNSNQ